MPVLLTRERQAFVSYRAWFNPRWWYHSPNERHFREHEEPIDRDPSDENARRRVASLDHQARGLQQLTSFNGEPAVDP